MDFRMTGALKLSSTS